MDTDNAPGVGQDSAPDIAPPDLTCSHCGRTASDVYLYPKLVAGQFVKVAECRSIPECWKNWDAQHKLPAA